MGLHPAFTKAELDKLAKDYAWTVSHCNQHSGPMGNCMAAVPGLIQFVRDLTRESNHHREASAILRILLDGEYLGAVGLKPGTQKRLDRWERRNWRLLRRKRSR